MTSQRCHVHYSILSYRRNHSLTPQDRRHSHRVDHRNFLSLSAPSKKKRHRKNMKTGYKLYYTRLSFRGFLNFFYLKREYVADTITSR